MSVLGWLEALGVKDGDWFIDTKHRARRAMKSACFSPPARIHICLGLATMGFQQELAVKMEGGQQVPIQPVDVCALTSLKLNHFREHINWLEAYGLAKCEGWTKGRVKIYSWAIPREVDPKKIVPRAGTIFTGCPPDLHSLLNHYRVRFPTGFVPARGDIEALDRLARVTKKAELSLRTYAKGLCARTPPNKEERNESNKNERTSSSSAVITKLVEKAEEEDLPPYEQFRSLYPAKRWDGAKAKPLFLRKEHTEQLRAVERLKRYLEEWHRDPVFPQFVPLASNWLQSAYEEEPLPPSKPQARAAAAASKSDAVDQLVLRNLQRTGRPF